MDLYPKDKKKYRRSYAPVLLVQRSTLEGSCKDNSCGEETNHADNSEDDGLLVKDNHCLFLYI